MLKRVIAFGIGGLLAAGAMGVGRTFASLPPKPPWPEPPSFHEYWFTGPGGRIYCISNPKDCPKEEGGKGGFMLPDTRRVNQPLGW